jgi:DNA topoisomerase-1
MTAPSTIVQPASQHQSSPKSAAEEAGLRYARLDRPGITRERTGDGWRYRDPKGKVIRDKRVLERIRGIVIPPAWTDVWICTDPRGHIQATGYDDRGRKQYRYHPKWRAYRDETKFEHLLRFGEALPRIREQVERDLRRPGLPLEKVLATVVRLLDVSMIRVGNRAYEVENGSYGLTTLRNRHVKIEGATIHFTFRGKSRIEHSLDLHDRRLATIVKRMRELPGYHLFQYVDERGNHHEISSEAVNAYLHDIAGNSFSAKDFRTWAGTVRFVEIIRETPEWQTEAEAKRNVVTAVKAVAAELGNTPAVCRASYIHPAVIDAYLDGTALADSWRRVERRMRERAQARTAGELVVLDLLHDRTA